jgi:hypothetical protein
VLKSLEGVGQIKISKAVKEAINKSAHAVGKPDYGSDEHKRAKVGVARVRAGKRAKKTGEK